MKNLRNSALIIISGLYIISIINGLDAKKIQTENIKLKQELKIAKTITYIQEAPKVENKHEKELIDYYILKYSKQYKVDKDLVYSIIKHESNFNPTVVSSAGCIGLMQVSPDKVKNGFSIQQNIEAGTKHLAGMIARYDGNIEKGVLSYNCGGNCVSKGHIPKSTKRYCKKVLIYKQKLDRLEVEL